MISDISFSNEEMYVLFAFIESADSSQNPRTLLDLNNDHLMEIFKYLSVQNLADVYSTCTRLKTVARDTFSRYHKSNCLRIDSQSYNSRDEQPNHRQLAAVLRNFGDLITKMRVYFTRLSMLEWNTVVFNLMSIYCTGDLEKVVLVDCW